jgi:sugar (pentulose or hexulose) kinase/phosphoglycerate dehydrogenase-like enzyme/ribulose-5-phosphate 4-epimerase/fuculose-1-phosphate aldolase/putative sterol carrier protein
VTQYLMGLDLGGKKGRCLLLDVKSGEAVSTWRPWQHRVTAGFGSDLDTIEVWRFLGEAAREGMAKVGAQPQDVLAVSTTGMRHGSVVMDAGGEVLLATPTRDARGAMQGLQLAAQRGREFHERTGHFPAPLFTTSRLLWMVDSAPELLCRAYAVLGLSDWLAYRLSGKMVAEPSVASESGLFEVSERRWADDLIRSLGLPRHLCPGVVSSGTVLGPLSKDSAAHLGLQPGIPVVTGGGDTQCGLLGAGVVDAGQIGIIAGSTMPLQWVLDREFIDAEARLWTSHHVVRGRWTIESNGGPSGDMIDWLAGVIYSELTDPAAALFAEASQSVVGAEGIVSTLGAEMFNASRLRLPLGHLTLSPMMVADDPSRRRHLSRAVVEGLAFAARSNIELLEKVAENERIKTIRLAGGMSKSAFFAQLLSDVIGVPVEAARVPECSALGAAICAGVGAGLYDSVVDGAKRFAGGLREFAPDPARRSAYQLHYDRWLEVRAARQKADEIAASSAVQAILAKAAENAERDVSKTGSALRPNILVTASMDEEGLAALRQLGEVRYESFRENLRLLAGEDLVEALAGVQVFITEVDAVDAEVLSKAPDLRVVASCRGNAVNVDIDACTAHGVLVLTTPARNADAVADLTVCFMLMLARKLPQATRFLNQPGEEGDVGRMGRAFEGLKGRELWRKTIGIVGLGAVGQRVAKRLQPFGAHVMAYDPFLLPEKAVLLDVEPVSLEQLLVDSDFVTLHAVVTDESRALLGAGEIAKMKRGAYLINTARAALVDQAALISALMDGRLEGAAVDVFPVEPPSSDHPLLELANVIATPHVGGNTIEVSAHQGAIVAADLAELLRGKQPRHVANRETLEHFSWTAPRPVPAPKILERLRQNSRPSVTDLPVDGEKTSAPKTWPLLLTEASRIATKEGLLSELKNAFLGRRSEKIETTAMSEGEPRNGQPNPHQNGSGSGGSKELRGQMEQLLGTFGRRVSRDEKILSFAEGQQVTVRYVLNDVNLSFYTSFDQGAVRCGVGDPPEKPGVTLKMKADILDKLFTGQENGPKAAMSGKLSFTGDTIKAMSLQRIQKDLNRLYTEARAEIKDLDAIFERAAHETPARDNPPPVGAFAAAAPSGEVASAGPILVGDIRDEVVRTVEEMYAHGLITSTGGNVSVRIPGKDEVWITPNSSFKGALRPDMLVRVDLEGNPIGDSPYAPSSERMLHCAVYHNSPNVGAVIHSHAPKATILGLAGLPFLPISTEAAFIGEIPRVPFIMPGTAELADAVGVAAKEAPAVIMQNHGLIVGGQSLRHASDLTLIIEQTADKLITCHMLGKTPSVLPDEIVTAVRSLGQMIV